jgi:hypothetical protein
LTEIETVGAEGLAVVVVSAPLGAAGVEGTAVAGVVVVGCTSIEGAVAVADDAASEPVVGALSVAVAPDSLAAGGGAPRPPPPPPGHVRARDLRPERILRLEDVE